MKHKFCLKTFVKLLAASLVLGLFGGVLGAAFSHLISIITGVRSANGWLVLLLPICGVFIVFLYKKLGIEGQGTNTVFEAADGKDKLSPLLSLGVFITAAISHLFGASVGREGAALQIGGSIAMPICKIFRLDKSFCDILVRVGMAAVFAAVFGTPLTAFLFVLEVVYVGRLHLKSALPAFLSSLSAFGISQLLGAHAERFNLKQVPGFSFDTAWKVAVLTVLTAFLSVFFCYGLHYSEKFAKKFINNPYLRIIIGGAFILGLTITVGNQDYNGAGVGVIERIFDSSLNPDSLSFKPEAFALKLIFTCISVAAGFKGGEIVPTLFIGSTFGALMASVLGLPVSFGAALCMVLLFSGVTDCALASVALGFELFSGAGFWYFIPTVAVCFILSGKISLYPAQKYGLGHNQP